MKVPNTTHKTTPITLYYNSLNKDNYTIVVANKLKETYTYEKFRLIAYSIYEDRT